MKGLRIPKFNEQFRSLLDERGLNQTRAAELLGEKNKNQISRWRTTQMPESLEKLKHIADTFGVSWQWLLVGDEGLKAMGALSPRDPIIIKLDDRSFAIAMYQETEKEISVYEIKHKGLRSKTLAATYARTLKDEQKL